MINSTNTVEFTLSRDDVAATMRRSQMVPSTKTHTEQVASIIHQQPQQQQQKNNSIFLSICSNELSQKNRNSGIVISEKFTPYTKDKKSFEIVVNSNNASNKERVKVQHLQTHTELQNNQWNYQTFCNLSTTVRGIEGGNKPNTINNINNNSDNNNISNQNESAFKLCFNENAETTVVHISPGMEQTRNMIPQQDQQIPSDNFIESDRRSSPVCRTEDQENAFRRIEDVHNYSKLNRYSYSNGGSSNSSVHEDEEDEEEEEEEEDDADAEVDGDDEEDEIVDEGFVTYQYFDRKNEFSKINFASKDIRINNHTTNTRSNNQDNNASVVTSTIIATATPTTIKTTATTPTSPMDADEPLQVLGTPDHHARRPMNAFLIFCKRHRAIVKDKYKSFENRAITKILGDWWASLDANDKKCYTNLAQQNKDAFFSANPNFKWYKLPAPPLRTLNTRPSNSERLADHDDNPITAESIQNDALHNNHYFKLADEAQMGELSTLMCEKKSNQINQNALQQALGETTHYFSTQIPDLELSNNKWKRKLHNDNSFSGNSSEEDLLPKKSSRSCKGKIYQELINSGQIAAITKKTKAPKVNNNNNYQTNSDHFTNDPNSPMLYSQADSAASQLRYHETIAAGINKSLAIDCNNTTNYELIEPFDLEKKIKELPALCLDAYLLRKRNTKKRKKFNSKKRTVTSSSKVSSTLSTPLSLVPTSPPITPPKEYHPPPSTLNQAVGSQKRKARKESITRRDISAMENEVASLLPLREDLTAITCNGRYYYNESPSPIPIPIPTDSRVGAQLNSIASTQTAKSNATVEVSSDFLTNINNNISSTSDLLILAEVAAKRTEISN